MRFIIHLHPARRATDARFWHKGRRGPVTGELPRQPPPYRSYASMALIALAAVISVAAVWALILPIFFDASTEAINALS